MSPVQLFENCVAIGAGLSIDIILVAAAVCVVMIVGGALLLHVNTTRARR